MSLEVANTIREQLGRMALAMIGARDLVGTSDSLAFRIGRNAKAINKLVIRLDPSDTYTVQAWRLRGTNAILVEEMSDVYCDMLHDVIERLTGLYTRL